MKVFENFLAALAPFDCLACGREGALVCVDCLPRLGAPLPSTCFGCGSVTDEFSFCERCKDDSPLSSLAVCFAYEELAQRLVRAFKLDAKRGACPEIVRHMVLAAPTGNNDILMPIPTASSRIRERGFDHALLLARTLSKEMKLPCLPSLARLTQVRQLGSSRAQRLTQLSGAFTVRREVHGKSIVLVDDVVTTGATLQEAARVLLAAGAARVTAIVFAKTE